jgi:hypothetical protein
VKTGTINALDSGDWLIVDVRGYDYLSFQALFSPVTLTSLVLSLEWSVDGTNFNAFGTPITITGTTASTHAQEGIEVRPYTSVRFRRTTALGTPVDCTVTITTRLYRAEV